MQILPQTSETVKNRIANVSAHIPEHGVIRNGTHLMSVLGYIEDNAKALERECGIYACIAGNDAIGKRKKLHPSTVGRIISRLEKLGAIKRGMIDGLKRGLTPLMSVDELRTLLRTLLQGALRNPLLYRDCGSVGMWKQQQTPTVKKPVSVWSLPFVVALISKCADAVRPKPVKKSSKSSVKSVPVQAEAKPEPDAAIVALMQTVLGVSLSTAQGWAVQYKDEPGRVRDAVAYYHHMKAEKQRKGETIDSPGGYLRTALEKRLAPPVAPSRPEHATGSDSRPVQGSKRVKWAPMPHELEPPKEITDPTLKRLMGKMRGMAKA